MPSIQLIERNIVMGLFSNILEKLGLKKKKEEEAEATKPAAAPAKPAAPAAKPAAPAAKAATPGAGVGARVAGKSSVTAEPDLNVKAIDVVDVVAQLEERAKGKELNWKVSIVDLLKLLELDSSREAREELAKELNCPADQMSDSARMNVWLHKEVLRQIAANGGNIPKELLD
jgi:3-oxoacyl-ACP reductase-like protein